MANQISEEIRETAMIDLTYDLLRNHKSPLHYHEIMKQIAQVKGFTSGEVDQYIAQLYTDINTDGRFVCVGRSLWGLRDWYPLDQASDSVVAANVKEDLLEEELKEERNLFAEDDDDEELIEDSYEDPGFDINDDDED